MTDDTGSVLWINGLVLLVVKSPQCTVLYVLNIWGVSNVITQYTSYSYN